MEAAERIMFHCVVRHPEFQHVSKKNGRPIFRSGRGQGRAFIGKSDKLRTMESLLRDQFASQGRMLGLEGALPGPYHAIYHFHFSKKHNRTRLLSDLSNLLEIVSDSLEKADIIDNDRFIESFDGSRKIKSEETKLEVFIVEYQEHGSQTHDTDRNHCHRCRRPLYI